MYEREAGGSAKLFWVGAATDGGGSAAPGGRLASGGGAAVGGPAAVGGRVGEEDSAERRLGAEGGAAGKTTEAPCRTIEAGGETVGAWSAGDAAEEVDGAAGGGIDSTRMPSAVLRGRSLGSVRSEEHTSELQSLRHLVW